MNGPDGDAGQQIADERRQAAACSARKPPTNASTRPTAIVAMSVVSCGMAAVSGELGRQAVSVAGASATKTTPPRRPTLPRSKYRHTATKKNRPRNTVGRTRHKVLNSFSPNENETFQGRDSGSAVCSHDELSLATRAAWLSYVGKHTQEEIAGRLGVSRIKVGD